MWGDSTRRVERCENRSVYSRADIKGIAQGEKFESAGIRVTAVLEKRDDKWVIVQYHGSVPVAGQVVEYCRR